MLPQGVCTYLRTKLDGGFVAECEAIELDAERLGGEYLVHRLGLQWFTKIVPYNHIEPVLKDLNQHGGCKQLKDFLAHELDMVCQTANGQ